MEFLSSGLLAGHQISYFSLFLTLFFQEYVKQKYFQSFQVPISVSKWKYPWHKELCGWKLYF